MRNQFAIAILVLAICASCASPAKDVLHQDGFIRSGWMVSIGHLGTEAYSSLGYAIANDTLELKVHTLNLNRDVLDEISCFIAPRTYGYEIVILSRRRLSREEEDKIRTVVNESLQIGSAKAREITKT
jgi:hypothetical protein